MPLPSILASLMLASAAPAADPPPPIPYLILGDEARRDRLERVLAAPAGRAAGYAPAEESGMGYASCVSAWRDDPAQSEGCIRSRLPRAPAPGTIVLNSYGRPVRAGDIVVSCVGRGGTGTMTLPGRPAAGDAAALRTCLEAASRDARVAAPAPFGTRFTDELEVADVGQARAGAARVLTVAIDHVGIPRGTRGSCLVQGRLVRVVRGPALAAETRVGVGVPCSAGLDGRGPRRISMADIRQGTLANIYLDAHNRLLDYEPVAR